MPNYGTPINPDNVPATKPAVLRTVALGFTSGAEAPQLPAGMSSRGSNFLDVDGGLVMRPGIRPLGPTSGTGSVASTVSQIVTWVGEGVTGAGVHYPLILSGKYPAYYSTGSWSALSQVGATGLSGNTITSVVASTDTRHFDATAYYNPTSDEFEMCFVHSAASGGAYTWRPGTAVFSTLTNSPAAALVCTFDNRLLFSRITSAGTFYPQRVQWSARGEPSVYTTPDGGFEELMDASPGVITRLYNDYDRVLVFFDREVWQGIKYAFPFNFQFLPLDRTIGCPAPRSIARTPKGVVFLGSDLNLYLIPRGGSPQPVGKDVRRLLLDDLGFIEWGNPDTVRVYGIYDEQRDGYLLFYDARTQPYQHGLFVNMTTGATSPLNINAGSSAQWVVRGLGDTRLADSSVTAIQRQRILLSGYGGTYFVGEWTSEVSNEVTYGPQPAYSILTTTAVLAERLAMVPNPNPSERLYPREVRMDYRSGSASSASVFFSGDFGTTYPVVQAVALPATAISAQTAIMGGTSAIYPTIKVAVSGHTTPVIQGMTVLVESLGNG